MRPFVRARTRDTFLFAAYAITRRETALMAPLLIRGHLPLDPKSLLQDTATWKQLALAYLGRGSFPADPRYVNDLAHTFEIEAPGEAFYTIDGEILPSTGEPFRVRLGPVLKVVVSPRAALGSTMRLAADVTSVLDPITKKN